MKHQIFSRYDSAKVLYECELPDGTPSGMVTRQALEKATLTGAYLTGANLGGANLTGANLTGANLGGANLAGAYLTGAKWRGIVINKAPLQLFGLRWSVTVLDAHMQIGCELHSLTEWANFDDARIAVMDGRHALRFWRTYKAVLLGLAAATGRVPDVAAAVEVPA